MKLMSSAPHPRSRGFTLLELAALLAVLSGLVFALLYKTTDVSIQQALQNTDAALTAADQQLRQFAAWNGRLPCPDTDADGIENCAAGVTKGTLPYRTLGLAAVGYEVGEQGGRALRYGVYRNASIDADLAVAAERFKPTNADSTAYDLGNRNSLDLCVGLATAASRPVDTSHLFVSYDDTTRAGMAYMLASPGQADADNDGDRYDGLNSASASGFNAPRTPISNNYDDSVRGRGLIELFDLMHCDVAQRSLDLAANAIALEEENIAFAESNQDSADQGVLMNGVGTALTVWSLAQAAAGVSGASEVQGISIGLLAGVTATCPIPPFVGCALIPVYTAATAAAATGLGLNIAAAVLSGTALGLQITATALYVDIADKAGAPDTADTDLGITQAMVDSAFADYQQANADAQAAESAYAQAEAAYQAGPKSAADASRGALEAQIGLLPADAQTAARDNLYGFPRPADIDPDNLPSDPVIGVESSIDAWYSAEQSAENLAGVDLVDGDGNPITDGSGNPVDLSADAQAAQESAQQRIEEAREALLASVECQANQPCPLRDNLGAAFDAHVDAYTADRDAWYELDQLRAAAENARSEADKAYDSYAALDCALQFNQDYDPSTNSCKAGAPGSGAGNAGNNALCDIASPSYDAAACADLQASQNSNPLCDSASQYYDAAACAALGTSSGPLSIFSGMDDLVRQLDSKGTVR